MDLPSLLSSYISRMNMVVLLLFIALFFWPSTVFILGIPVQDDSIRNTLLSLGILFLTLRGIVDAYYSWQLALIFLGVLLLVPFASWGELVLTALLSMALLKILRLL